MRPTMKPLYITIKEAKVFWIAAIANETADNIDYVEVHPCVCKWKAAHNQTHPCALNRMGNVQLPYCYSLENLQVIVDGCSLLPVFRNDTLCPKTRCDNGGTGGGWCANIMPDGSHHCLHMWCHRTVHWSGPFTDCTSTVHHCTIWFK